MNDFLYLRRRLWIFTVLPSRTCRRTAALAQPILSLAGKGAADL